MEGGSLVVLVALLLMFVVLFLVILVFFACYRRWRFLPFRYSFSPASSSRIHVAKEDDLETPLFSEDLNLKQGQNNNLARNYKVDDSGFQCNRKSSPPKGQGYGSKQLYTSTDVYVDKAHSIVLDVAPDALECPQRVETLKRHPGEHAKDIWKGRDYILDPFADNGRCHQVSPLKDEVYTRSCLKLEVISGPSLGLHCSRESTETSQLQVTLGRVPPSDLLLKDSEVSGKHAAVIWNTNKLKWELVDMGSLNGTLLNSQSIQHQDTACRCWSVPLEIADGDIITLGTSSRVLVKIVPLADESIPFGVGTASDPMAVRRGGKKLPMEDVIYCQWPLPGIEKFGLFCIFDGHGGADAAKSASRILPSTIAHILSKREGRQRVISICDASDVLRDAFSQTELAMDHQYEGCTATVLLVWADLGNQIFVQCANVGDSACLISIGELVIPMSEDHRVTSLTEQVRLREAGRPVKEGETRLCGLNLVRMLGDKFLKEQDPRFTSEPFVSQVVHIPKEKTAFALLASDGLWDVISAKKVVQLIIQTKERYNAQDNSADRIASYVLNEARTLRTKDNTSLIFLDFDSKRTVSSHSDL